MDNVVFGKVIENVRKHRDIKLVIIEPRRNYLVSEPNIVRTRFFFENLLTVETERTQVFLNKPVYLGLSVLEISKTVMCELWYDFVKPKFKEKGKLCYMDTDSYSVRKNKRQAFA